MGILAWLYIEVLGVSGLEQCTDASGGIEKIIAIAERLMNPTNGTCVGYWQ